MTEHSLPQRPHTESEEREERECVHCFSGWIYQSTEDPLVDEALVCHMCNGTGRRSVYLYPKKRKQRRA